MTDKLRILLDMDSILADFLNGLWSRVERITGERPKTADVQDFYKMEEALTESMKRKLFIHALSDGGIAPDAALTGPIDDNVVKETLVGLFCDPGFFTGLDIIPGAKEVVQALLADGHEIVVVSAPSSITSPSEKLAWLRCHFPGIDPKNVFIGSHKHMLKGDVLVDDALHNAVAYKKHWPDALVLTIGYPYNTALHSGPYDGRYESHDATYLGWMKIYAAIACRAGTV